MSETDVVLEVVREGGTLASLILILVYLRGKDQRLSTTLDGYAKVMAEQTQMLGKLVGIVQARLSTLVEGGD